MAKTFLFPFLILLSNFEIVAPSWIRMVEEANLDSVSSLFAVIFHFYLTMVIASLVCFQPNLLKATLTPNNDTYRLTHQKARRCDYFDLHNELIPYKQAWSWQKRIVREKKELIQRTGDCLDTLVVLQHQPVYTMGTGSSENYLKFDLNDPPFDVHRTERGGEVTYHGPGQLVMYPILNLRNHKMDLHWYLRSLEEVVIRALSSAFSIEASRIGGLTGVWVGDEKLASIGIKVSQWVTFHGVALNVTADLTPFDWIVPCGLRNRRVGSVKRLLAKCGDEDEDEEIGDAACRALVNEFSEIFQVEVNHVTTIAPQISNFKEP